MAASRWFRAGLPSLAGLALALMLPLCANASLDRSRLISTVRKGPLEMRVALEDSLYLPGQRTCALVCVTNTDRTLIPFVPVPNLYGDAPVRLFLWKIVSGGGWVPSRLRIDCMLRGIASYMIPPISPLEPSASTCNALDLSSWFGADVTPPEFRGKTHQNLYADPTYAMMGGRLATGRYALQVSYLIGGKQNHWREPVQLLSDTLFFDVSGVTGTWEDSLLAGYARAVDSAMALPRATMTGVAFQWLPRFSDSRLFVDVFMDTGSHGDSIPRDRLFAWIDPHGRRSTSRAMLLDLLFRLAAPERMLDPSTLSAFARGDLAQRVIQDWKARPRRWSFRDSVYAERKKYLIRGHPPYGTWVEPNNATEPPAGE